MNTRNIKKLKSKNSDCYYEVRDNDNNPLAFVEWHKGVHFFKIAHGGWRAWDIKDRGIQVECDGTIAGMKRSVVQAVNCY